MKLTNPHTIKTLLTKFRLKPNKSLGQHFLVSETILDQLVTSAKIKPSDTVIEVGAGIGTITFKLAKLAQKVIAYEIDSRLLPILQHNLHRQGIKNVTLHNQDILQDLRRRAIIPNELELPQATQPKVIGAIPYQITSPLLHELIYNRNLIRSTTLIIQSEVAQKIAASPPNGSYLSNFIQLFMEVTVLNKRIPPQAFWPQPEVFSATIKLETIFRQPNGNLAVAPKAWSRFLHKAFSQPRKMLNKVFSKDLLKKAQINPTTRPQEITLTQWLTLFALL